MKAQITILLLLVLLAACAPAPTGTLVPTATFTAVPPTVQSISPTSTITPQQPPACTFPLAQTTTVESTPENYTFSEPKVVLTTQDNRYNIVEWLPDNQQVLMTEDLYNTRESESDKFLRQSIELYNPVTGESKVYAVRHYIEEPPVWQPDLNAVVYPAMNFMGIDENTHGPKFSTRQMWISYGNPDTEQMLTDKLAQFFLAVKPDGSEMIYLSGKKISKLDKLLKDIPSVSFDSTQWDYAKGRRNEIPLSYQMAWQPDTSLVFLYGDGFRRWSGYTFILNTDTGQVCELNLDGWAVKAHWSPDGRYLATIRAKVSTSFADFTDLVVLDTVTGNLYTTIITPQEVEGKHYVDDFAWAPDNYHLLAVGSVFSSENNASLPDIAGLYLVDFISDQSITIPSTYEFYENMSQNNLAWSTDGSKLLIRCPTMEEERVCFISVKRTEQ